MRIAWAAASSPEVFFGEVTWTCCRRSVLVAATWWSSSKARVGRFTSCAGINRHVVGDARAPQERRKRLHPDL
jgi:hypothetical protein